MQFEEKLFKVAENDGWRLTLHEVGPFFRVSEWSASSDEIDNYYYESGVEALQKFLELDAYANEEGHAQQT